MGTREEKTRVWQLHEMASPIKWMASLSEQFFGRLLQDCPTKNSRRPFCELDMDTDVMGGSVEELQALSISYPNDEGGEEEEVDSNDDYEDDDDDEQEPVTLGFLEKPKNPSSLLRHLFPSKAGGSPAWLDPFKLPAGKFSLCDFCGQPLQFLLQVYAPISGNESTFHRSLYVFMCPSMNCLMQDQHGQWKRPPENASRSVKVFRSQLPRVNSLYSSEPPKHDGTDRPSRAGATLCAWCGTWEGNKVCGSCKIARYCSVNHQGMHWRSGHKIQCQQTIMSSLSSDFNASSNGCTSAEIHKGASKTLWPEYEIINEEECEFNVDVSENNESTNSLIATKQIDGRLESLSHSFEGDDDTKSWASFQERTEKAPGQVLRYSRDANAKPIWPMFSGRASKVDIPKCSHCGGTRGFEFQALPQLLYYFGVKNERDSLDWATIVVYTCSSSCPVSNSYNEEFAWVQLSSPSGTMP